jgi:hypothetical protein
LKYFLKKPLSSKQQKKWVTKILGYEYAIIYKKGKCNVMVYSLSRKEEEIEGSLCVISILQSNWVEEARIEWKQYKEACKTIQQLQEDPSSLDIFVWKNDLLWYHGRLYYVIIPNSNRRS